ncbi:hypothetical protein NE237_027249 [Protea cynaroides]|uniref:Uncharacterized protein n=1 Tax=Protea cynaroides TaxID=273540 RepID=A0A9Q0JT00_9MAGN|nr:hypothetical protein NE237_027249 [Protea cynaroides]
MSLRLIDLKLLAISNGSDHSGQMDEPESGHLELNQASHDLKSLLQVKTRFCKELENPTKTQPNSHFSTGTLLGENNVGSSIRKVSGEDETEEMKDLILEKFRVLFGLNSIRSPKNGNLEHGFSSPSPAPAPSPITMVPIHLHSHPSPGHEFYSTGVMKRVSLVRFYLVAGKKGLKTNLDCYL